MSRLRELLAPMPPRAYFRDDWKKCLCLVALEGSICKVLPLGFLSGAGSESMTDRLRWRGEVLLAPDGVCEVAAQLWKRFLRNPQLSADGHFASGYQISAITRQTGCKNGSASSVRSNRTSSGAGPQCA